MALYENDQDDY